MSTLRVAAVIAIALALLGCGGIEPMPEPSIDGDFYLKCVEAYAPDGWASTMDTHASCRKAAMLAITQQTGDPQP